MSHATNRVSALILPKKMYVPYLKCSNMSGVTCPMMKLFIQLDEAACAYLKSAATSLSRLKCPAYSPPNAIPYGRLERGQISAMMIHAQGPQLYPKWTTNSHTMTTAAQPSTLVRLPLVLVLGEDHCDDDVAGCHSDCADYENGLAAKFVHVCDGGHGGDPHDNSDHSTGQERSRVAGQAKAFEDLWSVVENGVDALS